MGVHNALPDQGDRLGELAGGVDAPELVLASGIHGADDQAVPDHHGDDVGKIVFSLGVFVVKTVNMGKKGGDFENVDAAVDFREELLLFRGVLLFHDGHPVL